MPDNIITREAGADVNRSANEAETLGLPKVDQSGRDAGLRDERRKKMFDNADDAATSFAEGIVDALTVGFIRETGEEADLRREANSGWSTFGAVVGTAGSLFTGIGAPARITRGAEALGKSAAKTVLRAGDKAIVTTAMSEAAAGAALTGATAFGHALMDTVIEDREFASEAIIDEMKLGGVLGGIGGGIMGAFGKAARRGDVLAQGGVFDVAKARSAFDDSIKAYDSSLDFYRKQYGALKGLREMDRLGPVSDGFLDVRKAALQKAERFQAQLRAVDPDAAFGGVDDAAHVGYREAAKNYRNALREVDDIMRADRAEIAQALDAGTATRVELNPMGKVRGDLDDLAARQQGLDERQAAQYADTETSGFQKAIDNVPLDRHASAARVTESLRSAKEVSNALESVKTEVDAIPLGMVEGQRTRQAAQGPQRAAAQARQRVAPQATIVEDLPAGAAAGAEMRAAQADAAAFAKAPDTVVDASPVDNFRIEDWFDTAQPGRTRPFHEAEARAVAAMEKLRAEAGGRFESAGTLGLIGKPAAGDDLLGQYMDQVVSARKAGRMVADEARGVATPLREAAKNILAGLVVDKLVGSKAAGFAVGFAGLGGRFAAASGRLARRASEAAAKFMSPTKVRTGVVAASNVAHAYSAAGPIADPVERIMEVQFLASHPDGVRERVRQSAGDLTKVAPDLVRALEDRAVAQVQRLAVRAPAIYFDKLGRPLSPPGGKMREFFEYENGIHDIESLLNAVANGSLTKPQAAAMSEGFPSMSVKMASVFFSDPEKLKTLSHAKLRMMEMMTGASLTGASDPMFLARQGQAWQPPQPAQPPSRPQAFNINPAGAPTPTQSNATGRAPGN